MASRKRYETNEESKASRREEMTNLISSVASWVIESITSDERRGIPVPMSRPYNPLTNHVFSGGNAILALMAMQQRGSSDARFMTFRQALALGEKLGQNIHVRAGAKSLTFMRPIIINRDDDSDPFDGISAPTPRRVPGRDDDGDPGERQFVGWRPFRVFHASQIEGLPQPKNLQFVDYLSGSIEQDLHIDRVIRLGLDFADAMGVEVSHDESMMVGRSAVAYYDTEKDLVRSLAQGNSEWRNKGDYATTLIHELYHSTGHESREGRFANEKSGLSAEYQYAVEEIRAEFFSLLTNRAFSVDERLDEAHRQYINLYRVIAKEKPNIVMRAAQEATAIFYHLMDFAHGEKPAVNWITRGSEYPLFFRSPNRDEDGKPILDTPDDWTGRVIVRGLAERANEDGRVEIADAADLGCASQYWGVYAVTADGTSVHVIDLQTEDEALDLKAEMEASVVGNMGQTEHLEETEATMQAQEAQTEGVLSALEAAGWTRSNGTAIASKSFETVNGRNEALAFITNGDGINRTLQFQYTSEGRNVTEADGALIPVGATAAQVSEIATVAAARAEKSIQESYGVRIAAAEVVSGGGRPELTDPALGLDQQDDANMDNSSSNTDRQYGVFDETTGRMWSSHGALSAARGEAMQRNAANGSLDEARYTIYERMPEDDMQGERGAAWRNMASMQIRWSDQGEFVREQVQDAPPQAQPVSEPEPEPVPESPAVQVGDRIRFTPNDEQFEMGARTIDGVVWNLNTASEGDIIGYEVRTDRVSQTGELMSFRVSVRKGTIEKLPARDPNVFVGPTMEAAAALRASHEFGREYSPLMTWINLSETAYQLGLAATVRLVEEEGVEFPHAPFRVTYCKAMDGAPVDVTTYIMQDGMAITSVGGELVSIEPTESHNGQAKDLWEALKRSIEQAEQAQAEPVQAQPQPKEARRVRPDAFEDDKGTIRDWESGEKLPDDWQGLVQNMPGSYFHVGRNRGEQTFFYLKTDEFEQAWKESEIIKALSDVSITDVLSGPGADFSHIEGYEYSQRNDTTLRKTILNYDFLTLADITNHEPEFFLGAAKINLSEVFGVDLHEDALADYYTDDYKRRRGERDELAQAFAAKAEEIYQSIKNDGQKVVQAQPEPVQADPDSHLLPVAYYDSDGYILSCDTDEAISIEDDWQGIIMTSRSRPGPTFTFAGLGAYESGPQVEMKATNIDEAQREARIIKALSDADIREVTNDPAANLGKIETMVCATLEDSIRNVACSTVYDITGHEPESFSRIARSKLSYVFNSEYLIPGECETIVKAFAEKAQRIYQSVTGPGVEAEASHNPADGQGYGDAAAPQGESDDSDDLRRFGARR